MPELYTRPSLARISSIRSEMSERPLAPAAEACSAITLDRADLPAVAQRRALAEQAAPRPRPQPSTRDLLNQLHSAGVRRHEIRPEPPELRIGL